MLLYMQEPQGDILVFLTGREEIDTCLQELADRIPSFVLSFSSNTLHISPTLFFTFRMPKALPGLYPLALHSGLTANEQQEAFEPPPRGSRKVVISTNIAEASVTIEGIKYVVDSGFVKVCLCSLDTFRVPLSTEFFLSYGRSTLEQEWMCFPSYPVPSPLSTNDPVEQAERLPENVTASSPSLL